MITKIGNCTQGNNDVTKYFDMLCKYWEEVDAMKQIRSCSSEEVCLRCVETDKEIEEDRVVKFLIGLNDEYNVVRSNIFTKKQVPSMDVVFDMVTQEEIQKKANNDSVIEASALYGSSGDYKMGQSKSGEFNKNNTGRGRGRFSCTHCGMIGHTKER